MGRKREACLEQLGDFSFDHGYLLIKIISNLFLGEMQMITVVIQRVEAEERKIEKTKRTYLRRNQTNRLGIKLLLLMNYWILLVLGNLKMIKKQNPKTETLQTKRKSLKQKFNNFSAHSFLLIVNHQMI